MNRFLRHLLFACFAVLTACATPPEPPDDETREKRTFESELAEACWPLDAPPPTYDEPECDNARPMGPFSQVAFTPPCETPRKPRERPVRACEDAKECFLDELSSSAHDRFEVAATRLLQFRPPEDGVAFLDRLAAGELDETVCKDFEGTCLERRRLIVVGLVAQLRQWEGRVGELSSYTHACARGFLERAGSPVVETVVAAWKSAPNSESAGRGLHALAEQVIPELLRVMHDGDGPP